MIPKNLSFWLVEFYQIHQNYFTWERRGEMELMLPLSLQEEENIEAVR